MSRRANGTVRHGSAVTEGTLIGVETDDVGAPISMDGMPVLERCSYYREWVGILDGEPQIDVWRIKVSMGICELQYRCYPGGNGPDPPGTWLLIRWED